MTHPKPAVAPAARIRASSGLLISQCRGGACVAAPAGGPWYIARNARNAAIMTAAMAIRNNVRRFMIFPFSLLLPPYAGAGTRRGRRRGLRRRSGQRAGHTLPAMRGRPRTAGSTAASAGAGQPQAAATVAWASRIRFQSLGMFGTPERLLAVA